MRMIARPVIICGRHLKQAAEKPVNAMMKSWIEQPGFPIVSAKRENNRLILTQNRFSYLPDSSNQTWKIPVRIDLYDDRGKFAALLVEMDDKETSVDLPDKTARL